MGASTLKKSSYKHPKFTRSFEALKLATTLKTLSPFAISIKHSAFSSLVLRLFEKVSASCSFFALTGFFVAKNCVFLFKWYHNTNYFFFPKLSPKLILLDQLLKAEKVLIRKNRMNLFCFYCILFQNINSEKLLTATLFIIHWQIGLNYICLGILSGWPKPRTRAAAFQKSWVRHII